MLTKILNKLFNEIGNNEFVLKNDDLTISKNCPSNGLDSWVRLRINYNNFDKYAFSFARHCYFDNNNDEAIDEFNLYKKYVILNFNFNHLLISKNKETCVTILKNICHKDKVIVYSVIYEDITYYVSFDKLEFLNYIRKN